MDYLKLKIFSEIHKMKKDFAGTEGKSRFKASCMLPIEFKCNRKCLVALRLLPIFQYFPPYCYESLDFKNKTDPITDQILFVDANCLGNIKLKLHIF